MNIGIQMDGVGKDDWEVNLRLNQSMLKILELGSVIMKEDSKEKMRKKGIGLRKWMKNGHEISVLKHLTSLQNHLARMNIGIVETGNTKED